MTSKKTARHKRAKLPRNSDKTKQFAKDWERPVSGKIEMLGNGRPRERRLEGNEGARLLEHISGEVKAVFEFAIETVMRRSEALSLTWQDIALKIPCAVLRDTKNGDARVVPLSHAAVRVPKGRTRHQGIRDRSETAPQGLGGRQRDGR